MSNPSAVAFMCAIPMPLRPSGSERSCKDAGALAGLDGPECAVELLHHIARREGSQVAAVSLAVGVALRSSNLRDASPSLVNFAMLIPAGLTCQTEREREPRSVLG